MLNYFPHLPGRQTITRGMASSPTDPKAQNTRICSDACSGNRCTVRASFSNQARYFGLCSAAAVGAVSGRNRAIWEMADLSFFPEHSARPHLPRPIRARDTSAAHRFNRTFSRPPNLTKLRAQNVCRGARLQLESEKQMAQRPFYVRFRSLLVASALIVG